MRGELDAVLFDAGGVLVLPDPTVLGPLLAPYGGDPTVERHVRAHYAGMAVKSEQGADEHDWLAYDEASRKMALKFVRRGERAGLQRSS